MIKQHIINISIIVLTGFIPFCAVSSTEEIDKFDTDTVEIVQSLELTPNIENGKKIYPLCANCHMKTGWGKKDGSFPVIAGQHRHVLIKQLADIRSMNRVNPTMYPFTDPESIGGAQSIADVTAYIASMKPSPEPGTGPGQELELGKELYQQHCMKCHGANAQGNNDAFYPKLKAQHYGYLLRNMKWIRDGYRKNGNPVMLIELKTMSDEQLDAIADYLSRL